MPAYEFELIKNVNCTNYENKILLTFDLDWCSDEVLLFVLNILKTQNIKATFFVTHDTPLLDVIRKNPLFELGIHPNFNFLLSGDFRYGRNVEEVLDYYLNIVPEAVSFRCHSLTQTSHILSCAIKKGLKFDCNLCIPMPSNIVLKPFYYFSSLLRLPHFFEDDINFIHENEWSLENYLQYSGIKVFAFHPIHVFLNTDCNSTYENAKPYQNNTDLLSGYINKNKYGTLNFLTELIESTR